MYCITYHVIRFILPVARDRTILAGNKTYDNCRNIYFYISDYKTTAVLMNRYIESKATNYEILFFIKRDKYWRIMEQYFNLPIDD